MDDAIQASGIFYKYNVDDFSEETIASVLIELDEKIEEHQKTLAIVLKENIELKSRIIKLIGEGK